MSVGAFVSRKNFVPREEDAHGAWICNEEKVAAFLPWFTDDPVAEAPLKLIIILSSCKNLLRLVSKLFKSHAEEGTRRITWEGHDREKEEETKLPTPNSLLPILFVASNDRFKPEQRFPNLKRIDCDNLYTLMDLHGCPCGLEELECGGCKLIHSLSPLSACTNLRKLNICDTNVSSLKPLMGCAKLEWLSISKTPVADLSPLSASINLKVLWMVDTNICDLHPLSGLHRLRLLQLGQTPVTDLSPLSTLSRLENLCCAHTKVNDLAPLSECSELKVLNIYRTSISSLNPILQCKKLKYLNYSGLIGLNEDMTSGYLRCIKEIMT